MSSKLCAAAAALLLVGVNSVPTVAADTTLGESRSADESSLADSCPPLPQFRLTGTLCLLGRAIGSQAFVQEIDTGRRLVLRVTEPLGTYRVASIGADSVVLTGDGCHGEAILKLTHAAASSAMDSVPAVVLEGLSAQVTVVRSGSLLDRLGLQPADVLDSVNTQKIQTGDEARDALAHLDDASLESIAVRRNGRIVVFVNRESTTARMFLATAASRPPDVATAQQADTAAAHGKLPEPQEER